MENFVKYRNLVLLLLIILFIGITAFIKSFFLDSYISEIELIGGKWVGKKYAEGQLDSANDDLNTAKILSDGSLNTVYSVFQNSLQKGKKQKINDESYQRFIDQNFAELGIKTSKYLVGSQSKSKKGLQFRDYSYEFTCNYSQLTNFLSILEGQEKLFKVDKLSIKNPITNYKNKEKANEIDVALTLSTVTLTRKKANNEQKK